MPVVIIAVLIGSSIGQILDLEKKAENIVLRFLLNQTDSEQEMSDSRDGILQQLLIVIIVFCFSANGVYGAIAERMGDSSVLLSKSILDFFTAVLFASKIGRKVSMIALPAVFVMLCFYFFAEVISPFLTSETLLNFRACGGAISIATGYKMSGIKAFPVLNMIPSLLLVIVISNLWNMIYLSFI